jgi:ADP-ribose pyrophosphatase YjhB (NUDIX family)
MKLYTKNPNYIEEEDVTETIVRVKALIINSNNQLLMGYSKNMFQFPGGHLEPNESLTECLSREIKEETGIELNIDRIEPFALLDRYKKDHPTRGNNRLNKIYYFIINTDEEINYMNTNYTEHEKADDFKLEYVNLDDIESELKNNLEQHPETKTITEEILEIIKEYKNIVNII